MSPERLRLLLGLMVLIVGFRFALELLIQPRELFSLRMLGDGRMNRLARILAGLIALSATGIAPAAAERLVTSLSTHQVMITSNFTGTELVLFGSVERDAATVPRRGGYDIVVTVIGPREGMVTRLKSRVFGIWTNTESYTFDRAPAYLAVLSNRPLDAIASRRTPARRLEVGLRNVPLTTGNGATAAGSLQRRLDPLAHAARILSGGELGGHLPDAQSVPRQHRDPGGIRTRQLRSRREAFCRRHQYRPHGCPRSRSSRSGSSNSSPAPRAITRCSTASRRC